MADLLSADKLLLFFIFFVPGFVSVKIWSLLVPSEHRSMADHAVEVLSFGCINFAILFWLVNIAIGMDHWAQYLLYIVVLFLFPMIWPIIVKTVLYSKFLRGKIVHPAPKAWDAFFQRGQPCFILVHLKSGQYVGGLYSSNSFASSFPNPEDLYIEQLWKMSGTGEFLKPMPDTKGLLISHDAIDFLELFKIPEKEKTNGKEKEQ
jgi:hypothetical protein